MDDDERISQPAAKHPRISIQIDVHEWCCNFLTILTS